MKGYGVTSKEERLKMKGVLKGKGCRVLRRNVDFKNLGKGLNIAEEPSDMNGGNAKKENCLKKKC